jgi:hypothetical protein
MNKELNLTQDYSGWCKVNYGYTLSWKPWIIHWENEEAIIYIDYDSQQDIIYHYKDETKNILIDHYSFVMDNNITCENVYKFYTRHNESNNSNYRTKYLYIIRMLS